jgi:WD40 repeat protein
MKLPRRVLPLAILVPLLGCGGSGGSGATGSGPNPQGTAGRGESGKPRFTIDSGLLDYWGMKKAGPREMALSPDGKLLLLIAQSKDNQVQVWDLEKRQKLHALTNDIGTMNMPIAVSPDGRTGAYVQLRPDAQVVLFDVASGKEARVIKDQKRRLDSTARSLRFSPRDDLLVLAWRDEIVGWHPATGNERFSWKNGAGLSALSTFFEDGKKITSLDERAIIKVWDVASGKPMQTLTDGHSRFEDLLAVSSDGKALVSQGDGLFKFWDLPAGTVRKEITEARGTYPNILIVPDNRTVIWSTHDGFVLYELASGAKKQEIKAAHEGHLRSLAVTADGRLLLSAGDDALIKGWSLSPSGEVE